MCVGVCSITVARYCAACTCEGVLKDGIHGNGRRKVVCAGEKDLDDQKRHKRRSSVFVKNPAKPKDIIRKNKFGYPDSTNNSLEHPEESLDNDALQATNRSAHNDNGQAKTQTELTCAVSQAERIFNICEIGYEIHISLKLSSKFGGIIPILFSIKPD